MKITFEGEAYESFQQACRQLNGYVVTLFPEGLEGEGSFDAILRGPATRSSWGDAVLYQNVDDDYNARGFILTARVDQIHVH